MNARRTSWGSTPMRSWQFASMHRGSVAAAVQRRRHGFHGLGDGGGSVAVTSPGGGGGMVAAPMRPATAPTSAAVLASQLAALDHAGSVRLNDPLCGARYANLVYDISCDHITTLLGVQQYETARAALAPLAAQAIPAGSDPVARRAYYSAVVNYAWIMTWASNLMGLDLVGEIRGANNDVRATHPGGALGVLPGRPVPTTAIDYSTGVGGQWGPALSDTPEGAAATVGVGVYETFWQSDLSERRAETVSGGVHHAYVVSSGRVYCERAKALATKLASYDFATSQIDAFTRYLAYLQDMKNRGFPLNLDDSHIRDLGALLANARSQRDEVTAGIGATAALVNVIPIFGQIASGILAIITAILRADPAVGAVFCPMGFNYRVIADPSCNASAANPGGVGAAASAATPLIHALVQAQEAAKAAGVDHQPYGAAASTTSPWLIGAGVIFGFGALALVIRKLRS